MKKVLLLFAMAFSTAVFVNAQVTTLVDDDFEGHPVGSYFGGLWSNWSLTSNPNLNLIITEDQASSGTKSGYIGPNNGNNGQDVFLRMLQTHTSGIVTVEWKMYIPDTAFAYFNLQETITPGESWGFECSANFYNTDNDTLTSGYSLKKHICWTFVQDSTNYLHSYAPIPTDEWFTVKHIIDYNTKRVHFYVNDVEATYTEVVNNDYPGTEGSFGGLNFYSREAHTTTGMENTYYIDDMQVIRDASVSVKEVPGISASVSVYPNPTNDYLNILSEGNIANVTIFNVVGQQVVSTNPNSKTVKINVQNLASGFYTATVITDGKKVVKEFVIN